jgi:hypothetical protein
MAGYPRNPDLRGRDYLVFHYRASWAFCRVPVRDNPVWCRVASHGSAVQTFKLTPTPKFKNMKKNIWRAIIEVTFIIFLFYSNLLMGEFERSGMGEKRGLAWAMADVFTSLNFGIALIAALVGYVLFEFLRKRF